MVKKVQDSPKTWSKAYFPYRDTAGNFESKYTDVSKIKGRFKKHNKSTSWAEQAIPQAMNSDQMLNVGIFAEHSEY